MSERSGARPVRVGVIGGGGIAMAHHLPALARAPGARVVAVADPDARARERVRRVSMRRCTTTRPPSSGAATSTRW